MTRMQEQKAKLLAESIKNIKALRHLTGNNSTVAEVQKALEGLRVVV